MIYRVETNSIMIVLTSLALLTTFLTAHWLSSTAAYDFGTAANTFFATVLPPEVTREVQAALDPVVKTITAIGWQQCTNVEKFFAVEYVPIKEPDLSELDLVYINKEVAISYSLSDPNAAQRILSSTWFNLSAVFIVYVHGFSEDPTMGSYTCINTAYQSHGVQNIVALDASSMIRYFYLRASGLVEFVGEALTKILANLVEAGVDPKNIHLIGHSLGAHMAGFAGKTFHTLTGARIGRITGLDAAGPCFSDFGYDLKLNSDDAEFVIVIHTNDGFFGLNEQIVHADFYPSGGSLQPNCLYDPCSHGRSWVYYCESVLKPTAFLGVQCASWEEFREGLADYNDISIMGHGTPPTARGTYQLQVGYESPFGLAIEGTKYNNNEGSSGTYSTSSPDLSLPETGFIFRD